jgi:hypothetical protein
LVNSGKNVSKTVKNLTFYSIYQFLLHLLIFTTAKVEFYDFTMINSSKTLQKNCKNMKLLGNEHFQFFVQIKVEKASVADI